MPPQSTTETFAAVRLFIDNWRWQGVPIYLRSGKRLWKRGTEIVVQFKNPPDVVFRGTPVESLEPNRLIFHIQPDQGIEMRFQAKTPGPQMSLQNVNMRFDYSQAFTASRATGYEVLLYNCMNGDATLFSRTDLVETAWRIAQPMLDAWKTDPADFPNYAGGSWGPKAAFELIERDGRKWVEILNRETLQKVPLFEAADAVLLASLIMVLKPVVFQPGDVVIQQRRHWPRDVSDLARRSRSNRRLGQRCRDTRGRKLLWRNQPADVRAPKRYRPRQIVLRLLRARQDPTSRACCGIARSFLKSMMEIAQARYNVSAEELLSEED